MDTKSASRSNKKSANGGPGTAGDRKKPKTKKKKDKRKPSLKENESTDIPSPELDSEVPFDGDTTLTDHQRDGQSLEGQVTKLPHLSSSSSVSLTTQVLPRTVSSSSQRNSQLGQVNSAPATRSFVSVAADKSITTVSSATTTTAAMNATAATSATNMTGVDAVVARVANLNIKQRSSKQRSKGQSSKPPGKTRPTKDRRVTQPTSSTLATPKPVSSECLRWEFVLDDVEQERERIAIYKMNRRKRYLAAAQAKGLRWALNYTTNQMTASPQSEDSGVDTAFGSPGYLDFGGLQALRAGPNHRSLHEAFVEC